MSRSNSYSRQPEREPDETSEGSAEEQDQQVLNDLEVGGIRRFLQSRVQITLVNQEEPSIWGKLKKTWKNPSEKGEAYAHLIDVQVDNDDHREYNLPLHLIKKIESLQGEVAVMNEQSLPTVVSDRSISGRSRPSSRGSQSFAAMEQSTTASRTASRSRPGSALSVRSLKEITRDRSVSSKRSHLEIEDPEVVRLADDAGCFRHHPLRDPVSKN